MVRRNVAATNAQGTLTISTNLVLFPAKNNRSYLEIRNTHASGAIDVSFNTPAVVGQGIRILAGQSLVMHSEAFIHIGTVNIISGVAATYIATTY